MRAAEKIIEGLTQMMEGFVELQSNIEKDFDADGDDGGEEEDADARLEVDAALVTEIRATIEAVMDAEDYSPSELANFISLSQEALEEIDPDVFREPEEEEESEEAEYYEDDTEYDDDDDFGDLDDDEEFDDEDFDEDEDEDDEEDEDEDDDD